MVIQTTNPYFDSWSAQQASWCSIAYGGVKIGICGLHYHPCNPFLLCKFFSNPHSPTENFNVHQAYSNVSYSSVWRPGVSLAIEHFVQSCTTCQKLTVLPIEPLIMTTLSNYPWEWIAADLFELKGWLVADYLSRFIEYENSSSNTATQLKNIFARFKIPATMVIDNGPQFDSNEMKEFAQAYDFQHTITQSQSNGFIERMVKTVKNCWSTQLYLLYLIFICFISLALEGVQRRLKQFS